MRITAIGAVLLLLTLTVACANARPAAAVDTKPGFAPNTDVRAASLIIES